MSIVLPIAANRRGACPTLREPMQTGDGLLARLRVRDGRLTPDQLAAIADLAAQHGNGLVEITARGNLQVRGLTSTSSPPFALAVEALLALDTGVVVETTPLAGDDPTEITDPRPLAARIRESARALGGRLGPKVTVVVDGGGQIDLAALKADIRLVARDASHWSVGLGGGKPQVMDAEGAMTATLAVLNALAALGPDARASDLFPGRAMEPAPAARTIGHFDLRAGHAVGIALPFGSSDHLALQALAVAALRYGVTEFRLAPHHALLAVSASPSFIAEAAALDFITEPDDRRQHISACIGSDGCASGHVPARRIAADMAAHLAPATELHVSGCSKGCARPRAADITLVGRPDGFGLVIGGRAGDTPATVLRADQLESAVAGQG